MNPVPTAGGAKPGRRFENRVVVVTGAGQGIGRAVANRIAAEGGDLVIADLHPPGAERVVAEVRERGCGAEVFVGDLTRYAAAVDLVQLAIDRFGRIDVLVNNVGGATALRPFHEWQPEDIVAEMHRSVLPTLWCCRAALPGMIDRRYGRIVNVGAESVRNGLWDRAPYNAGKGAVHALTTSIARETAELGITCNCAAPGTTNTGRDRLRAAGVRVAAGQESETFLRLQERTLRTIPMNRASEAEEQAAAIVFLASDDASFITGQVVSVNGGSSML